MLIYRSIKLATAANNKHGAHTDYFRYTVLLVMALALSVGIVSAPFAGAIDATTPITRVSTDSSGAEGDDGIRDRQSISADGRYVAFSSYATNIHPDDTDWNDDIFVKDTQTGTLELVSISTTGVKSNNSSFSAVISGDGRYVVFNSAADNLVAGDMNGEDDIFIRDRQAGTTVRVNTSSAGDEAAGYSNNPTISADGRYVAFVSSATNLVPGDTNSFDDIFVKDLQTGTTSRVSTDSAGAQGNGFSDWPMFTTDNRYLSFSSTASNLVSGDTNGRYDVFVKDLQTGTTSRVSTDSAGSEANHHSDGIPVISGNGRYVAFESRASNLVANDTNAANDVFVKDLQTGVTTMASSDSTGLQGDTVSSSPWLSGDGRFLSFESYASNLVPGDTNAIADVFIKDLQTSEVVRVSTDSAGGQSDAGSSSPTLSQNGRYVAFYSVASNLVSDDENFSSDIFMRSNPFAQVLDDDGSEPAAPVQPSETAAAIPNAPNAGVAETEQSGTGILFILIALTATATLITLRHKTKTCRSDS
jgi:archaellum component FlaF (FlaF/FlaG flagellin family)